MKVKYEIEHEDAPCGYVTFYNYKEPLMKFDEGFGFIGALIFDGKTEKVQCHLCGEWLGYLPHHLKREHNMTASAYKNKVGLLQSTALISESARAKLIASGQNRFKNLIPGGPKSEETKEKIRQTLLENGKKPENKNKNNTCPAQLIDRMHEIANKKGKDLRISHFENMRVTIKKNFGTMKEACEIAGIEYNKQGKTYKFTEKYKETTKEQMIESLKRFERINNRKPSASDCRRGLLSSYQTYVNYFGSWKKAIKKAFNN